MSATTTKASTGTVKKGGAGDSLPPCEWDFRGITPDHLPAILYYERARENKQFGYCLSLVKKHRSAIFGWNSNEFAKDNLVSQFPGSNADDDYKCFNVIAASWLCKKFPTAWMALSESEQDEAARRFTTNESLAAIRGFRILNPSELAKIEAIEESIRGIFSSSQLGHGTTTRIFIEVDWARLDNPVLTRLFSSLVNLRPTGIRPKKRSTGKAATIQFHKLKQLAAWRLSSKARFSFTKAQKVILDREEAFPRNFNHALEIFPKYESSGAWSDAVAAGKKFVIRGC